MKHMEIRVKGMHCGSCAKIIQDRLLEFKGIESAEASFASETVKVSFDDSVVSREKIEAELAGLGYPVQGAPSIKETKTGAGGSGGKAAAGENSPSGKAAAGENSPSGKAAAGGGSSNKKATLRQGIVYGLVPHIGCIGFIVASVLGATVAVEFFKPLLVNPWFFHILVAISIGFATLSSAIYLRKNGVLSFAGVKRKKAYLATMYGVTVGINLFLFLAVFPALANLDTGSFANPAGMASLAGAGQEAADSVMRLQVNIPCPGHAPLISGELKTIAGVTGVRYNFPNYFDVAFVSGKTSKAEILSLEVFEIYPAAVTEESTGIQAGGTAAFEPEESQNEGAGVPEQGESYTGGASVKEVGARQAGSQEEAAGSGAGQPASGYSCGGSCGGCGCGCGGR